MKKVLAIISGVIVLAATAAAVYFVRNFTLDDVDLSGEEY